MNGVTSWDKVYLFCTALLLLHGSGTSSTCLGVCACVVPIYFCIWRKVTHILCQLYSKLDRLLNSSEKSDLVDWCPNNGWNGSGKTTNVFCIRSMHNIRLCNTHILCMHRKVFNGIFRLWCGERGLALKTSPGCVCACVVRCVTSLSYVIQDVILWYELPSGIYTEYIMFICWVIYIRRGVGGWLDTQEEQRSARQRNLFF